MGKNRHRKRTGNFNRQRRNLLNLAPLELRVAESIRDHLGDKAIASLLGIDRKKVNVLKKSLFQKTECRNEQDLGLYLDVYLLSVKNRLRILE